MEDKPVRNCFTTVSIRIGLGMDKLVLYRRYIMILGSLVCSGLGQKLKNKFYDASQERHSFNDDVAI